jgi:AMP-binding enzyme/Poly-beta-hydroxybutyrate polymerase (PhaC) N-terminus
VRLRRRRDAGGGDARFEGAFGCIVLEGYGLSETSPVASFNHPDRERKPGTIGTPIRGVQMRVVDEQGNDVAPGEVGEIAIRGHDIMKGYWGRPEATAEAIPDGWFRTGDMGRVDADGYFTIVDRKKDLTSTAKLAAGLLRHPRATGRRLGGLAADVARAAVGRSTVAPARGDRRFTDPAWTHNPVLHRVVQAYLATARTAGELVSDAGLGKRDELRVRFLVENLVEALSPSNAPWLNPASVKAAVDTGGVNFLRGSLNLARDLATPPRVPQMVDGSPFHIGRNIAAIPGAVVLRTEQLELIQYRPQTERVYTVPLVIAPPTIDKRRNPVGGKRPRSTFRLAVRCQDGDRRRDRG